MTFYTTNDRLDKSKYDCYNNDVCYKGITYDDWHCSGCQWKGLGTTEREWDPDVKERADKLTEQIFFRRVAEGRQ